MSLDDEPSQQLQSTLQESIDRDLSKRRPILTHLNADSTWLLSIPYPATSPSPDGRLYWHVLIDPWLRGGQSDVATFVSQQWHKEPSFAQTIEDVEDIIKGIEDVSPKSSTNEEVTVNDTGSPASKNWINMVIICHEFTDHMHKETLLEIRPTVPVLAAPAAAIKIRAWKHFDFVKEIPRFSGDWRDSSQSPLPEWVGVSRVAYAGSDLLYYHQAIMVAFGEYEAEAVIYTPHGITPANLAPIPLATPRISTLALLHGLQDLKLGAQLNMGAHNGLKAQRLLKAKFWIGTHDEIKRGVGLVSWLMKRKIITFKEAVEREKEEFGGDLKGSALEGVADVRFEELGNGESLVLD